MIFFLNVSRDSRKTLEALQTKEILAADMTAELLATAATAATQPPTLG